MKVVDCFTFYNELDLLEIRLNELDEVVDNFVIVEAEKTHQNNTKPLYYQEASDEPRFKKWKDRIINVVVPASSFTEDTWFNENNQFRAIREGLSEFSQDDLIMIGAADEIPNKNRFKEVREKLQVPMCFHQKLYFFYLNTLYATNGSAIWPGTIIQKLSQIPEDIIQLISTRPALPPILDGGWHFSFLKKNEQILKKIKSFAHQEFNTADLANLRSIEKKINLGVDIFDRPYQYKNIQLDETFPKYILENKFKFKDWII